MTFILRWPVVLILLGLVVLCLGAAAGTSAIRLDAPIDTSMLTPEQIATIQQASWLEVGLWAGAGLFFLISAIRLMRRTQGFWTWLLGFALYGGRWAVAQQQSGGLQETAQTLRVESFQPEMLAATPEAPAAQITVLGAILIIGLIIFIIDAADRAYWDRQGA